VSVRLPIQPGETLGVLGGGQLGRMFVHAAQRLGYRCVVLDPDPDSPAAQVAEQHLQADYGDVDALAQLSSLARAVTIEFENVPAQTLRHLSNRVRVAPGAEAVAICQDRALEKAQFARCGVACAPHALVDGESSLPGVADRLLPGILKSARLGYDGKGQRSVRDRDELSRAWRELDAVPCVLEQRLPLSREISVVLARGSDGHCVHFAPFQNLHRDGILAVTQWPAPDLSAVLQVEAIDAAETIARSMDYVGVLCVEFFVLADGTLCANEIAPRPHNSGHCTIDACDVSQFDLQVRALAGLPLAVPRMHSNAVMLNLLGDLWPGVAASALAPPWPALLAMPGAHLHLYGKRHARPGRKMGHLTLTAQTQGLALAHADEAAQLLGLQ